LITAIRDEEKHPYIKQDDEIVMLCICIRESNLGQADSYTDWGFSWFSSV